MTILKPNSPWRTFIGLMLLGSMMLGALGICRNAANGQPLLSTVVTGLGALGLLLAGRATAETIANAKKDPPKEGT
jgi:hypothetical protein